MKGGKISEDLARRMVAAIKWVESQRQIDGRAQKPRIRRGRGPVGMLRYKLLEQLDYRDSANARLTYQNNSGTWSDGPSNDAGETVYDALLLSGQHLPSGSYVYCCRDHASGLLNVVNADNCATA